MAEGGKSRFKESFRRLRDSGKTKDFLVFLVFVFVAALFWFILTLNDEVQESYNVALVIDDVPDSVTFISPIPASIGVSVKDRGMNLLRYKVSGTPSLHLKFQEYADGEYLRVSHTGLNNALRQALGQNVTISSVTPDSLRLLYTRNPGRTVPVELVYDVTVSPGMVLGEPKVTPAFVSVFSQDPADTLQKVLTQTVVIRDMDKTTTVEAQLKRMPGRRMIPDKVSATFSVEQLVKKDASVPIVADRVPYGDDILFFPSKASVTYYVPMSHYNDTDDGIKVEASFNEAVNTTSDKVGIRVTAKAPYISKIELHQDSVEYTLVRAQ